MVSSGRQEGIIEIRKQSIWILVCALLLPLSSYVTFNMSLLLSGP